MKGSRRAIFGLALAAVFAGSAIGWLHHDTPHYLDGDTAIFMQQFRTPPPAADSTETRHELDALLELQRTRSEADVAAARADRKTDIARFYGALGLDERQPPALPQLRKIMERVEDDVRPYVRTAKEHFRRLRPYEIEPRLKPCIDDVRADLSYPSGHATYGYVMAYLLADMVPERRTQLEARGDEFARQRMVCGVHFPSDIRAGSIAARWLVSAFEADPDFLRESATAMRELREALRLPPLTH
jgi:acid phosphatase (class A)